MSDDLNLNFSGPPGPSAYEIWLAEGNEGTLEDFLESLRGEPGTGAGATAADLIEGTSTTKSATPKALFDVGLTPQLVTDAKALEIKTGGIAREERAYGYTGYVGFDLTPAPAARTYLINRPLIAGDRLLAMELNIAEAGTGQLGVFEPTYDVDGVTIVSTKALALYNVTVAEGRQTIAYPEDASFPDHRYPVGSLAGYYPNGTAVVLHREKAGPEGPALRINTLAPGIGVSRATSTVNTAPDMAMVVEGVVPDITEGLDELRAKTRRSGARKAAPATAGNSLYRWRSKLERIKGGDANGIARILLLGSSIMGFRNAPQGLATALGGSLGLSGHGWLGVNGNAGDYRPLNDGTVSKSAGWTISEFTGRVGIDGYAATTTTAGASYTWTNILCSSVDIWTADNSGVFRWQVDGGAWTTVTAAGTDAYRKTTISAGAHGLHSIKIETVDTAVFRLCGLYARGNVAGVEVSQAGHGGSDEVEWNSFISGVIPIITDIDPDIQLITVDTNALRGHRKPSQYKEVMLSIVAAMQTAAPSSAIELWTHADVDGEHTYSPADYGAVHDDIARANDMVEVYSCLDRFADWEAENALGSNADDLHLSLLGGRKAMADYCQVRLGVDPTHQLGATANSPDTFLLALENATGELPMAQVAGLEDAMAQVEGIEAAIAPALALTATILTLPPFATADAMGTLRLLQPTQMHYGFVVTRGIWLDTNEIYDPVNDASSAIKLANQYVFLPPFADGSDMLYASMLVQGTGQVPAGYSAITGQPFSSAATGNAVYDPAEIVAVPVSTSNVNVYRKGSTPTSARYIRQHFYRFTDASATVAADVWRLGEQWECERTGTYSFVDLHQIGNDAETDTAIWPNTGATSYATELVGGKEHGGELTDYAAFTPFALADGKPVSFAAPFTCHTLEFFQQTGCFLWTLDGAGNRTALSASKLCTINKRHSWSASEGYRLDYRVTWNATIALRQCYLGMGLIYRVNPAAEQITDRAYASPGFVPQDVSAAGYADFSSVATRAKLTGPAGISWEWEDLTIGGIKAYSVNGRTFFRDTSNRNKFYPTYSGTANVTAGSVWDISNRQKISTAN